MIRTSSSSLRSSAPRVIDSISSTALEDPKIGATAEAADAWVTSQLIDHGIRTVDKAAQLCCRLGCDACTARSRGDADKREILA